MQDEIIKGTKGNRNNVVILVVLISLLLMLSCSGLQASNQKFNLRTTPVSDLLGIVNVDLDIAVSPKVSVGPTYSHFNFEISDVTLANTLYGLRLNYYLNRAALAGGWMASVNASFGDFEISETRSSDNLRFSTTSSVRIYTALFSYQAMWDRFNMAFGVGASYFSIPETTPVVNGIETYTIDTGFISGIVPSAEFSVGLKF